MTFADCRLEHVFDVEVLFGADRTVFGPLPGGGQQGFTPAIGGTISGPRLSGSVVPHSGADFPAVRGDGVIELNAHYLLQAEDGTLIYIMNKGYLIPGGEDGRMNDEGMPQPGYFRLTPFSVRPPNPTESVRPHYDTRLDKASFAASACCTVCVARANIFLHGGSRRDNK